MRILLVEDEEEIAEAIRRGLEKAGYRVDVTPSGQEGPMLARDGSYGLLLLDVMLPDIDGCTVCERLRRARNPLPVLMLTARDAVSDRVRGLEAGADDYLIKPFDFSELVARVRALLRRDKVHRTRLIEIADLCIDTVARRVSRAGREIALTPREYALLETLAMAEGRVLTREVLQEVVWTDEEVYPNTVDVCIGHLRRKIDTGYPAKLIRTIHGVGYRLEAEREEEGAYPLSIPILQFCVNGQDFVRNDCYTVERALLPPETILTRLTTVAPGPAAWRGHKPGTAVSRSHPSRWGAF